MSAGMCIAEVLRASYQVLGDVLYTELKKVDLLNLGDRLEFPEDVCSELLCSSAPSVHCGNDRIIAEVAVSC